MALIDFDANYEGFVREWAKKNAEKLREGDDPSVYSGEIYEQWLSLPIEEAGGLSPKEYFCRITPPQAVDMLKGYRAAGVTVPMPLVDRLAEDDCEGLLKGLLNDEDEQTFAIAASLLEERQSGAHMGKLIEKLLDSRSGDGVKGLAIEFLSSHADDVKEELLSRAGKSLEGDMLIADVLVHCKGDDRIYQLLVRLFLSEKDNPLYSSYLGMYEDERALPLLMKRINHPEVGYVEFLELRNAIERLGGDPIPDRDFGFDPDYRLIKGIK